MSYDELIQLLIVEDDEDDYFLLESSLKETSFKKNITWARSYNDALELLASHNFDLAIIDYKLGLHTGIELISFIRDTYPFLPTILLTGLKASAIDREALKSGVYDYLAKDQYSAESIDRSIRYAIEKAKVLKSLKESENKFKSLFENAAEYVFLVDPLLVIIDANKAALKLFNCDQKDQLIGRKISDYVSTEVNKAVLHAGSSQEMELFIPELNKKRACIMNISLVDTEKKIYQWVLHDITERILNEQREKAMEKQALTGKFARLIAHEIKNPLSNIHLSVLELRNILKGMVPEKNDENPDDFLNIIDRNGQRINMLIEDLLNATRFDTLTMRRLNVEELLSDTLAHLNDRVRLKEIKVEKNIQRNLVINGDKEKLEIALLNIFVNAVEAVAEKTGQLLVNTFSSDGKVCIAITDNGKGISPQNLGKIFEPFFTSKKGGTGLGLTAAYNIIIKHDGFVKVESEVGKGTSFFITFPALS